MKGRWESNINVWFPFMYSRKWNCYFQNRIIMFCLPVLTLIYLWEICMFPGSVCLFCCGKNVDRSWEYINRSQTHECGYWDWGRAIPRKEIHKWYFPCSVRKCIVGGSIPEVNLATFELRNWLFWENTEFRVKIVFFITKNRSEAFLRIFSGTKFWLQPYLGHSLRRRPVLWRWRGRVSQRWFVKVRGWPPVLADVNPGGRVGPLLVTTEVEG